MKIILVHTPFNWKRPLTILAHLIRKVAGTFYNHCAIIIELNGTNYVLESDINGVVMTPLRYWVKEQTVTVYQELSSSMKTARAMSRLGVSKYDFLSLFWFQPIYNLTGKYYGFTKERKAEKRFYCYEYVAWVLVFKDWFKITPNQFVEEIRNRNLKLVNYRIKAKDLL